ncbi:MAG: leucine-rich repeat domain-containing protein [Ruminococcus sp.]|nr:leucine-rich repeat domain-containing protein [Ruminococcus sp.]
MKKFLSVLLAAIMLFCIMPTSAFASDDYGNVIASGTCGADPNPESVTWTRYDSGTLVFSGNGAMRDFFRFDQNYCEYKNIDYNNQEVDTNRVIIKDGITYIGENSFSDFRTLKSVEIAGSVIEIGKSSFASCYSLESVLIGEGTEFIHDHAFILCKNLNTIQLPTTLKIIGNSAFSTCINLDNVTLPKNLITIERNAFFKTEITSLNIPATTSTLDNIILSYYFKSFTVDKNNPYFCTDSYGVLYTKDMKTLLNCPSGITISTYTIPNTVEKINPYAFAGCINIKKINMPNSITYIGSQAFDSCISLESINLSNNIALINDFTFNGCISLKNIEIPSSVKYIGDSAFNECLSLKNFTIYSNDTEFNAESIGYIYIKPANDYSMDNVIDLYKKYMIAEISNGKIICGDPLEFEESITTVNPDQATKDTCTIYCHPGSTAETYAIENKVSYETVHFFGDWTYDWDNLVREHTCSICNKTETEVLEATENGGVEIVTPTEPDKKFDVEQVEENSNNYVIIQNAVGDKGEIVKAFNISLKNKDGVHVQPNGTVKVKLPNDWKHNSYKVYRINDDGTYTDMNAYREGSHIVFETDHFSLYVIVDESESAPEEPTKPAKSPFEFINNLINWFKNVINKVKEFFRSIGDRT